MFTLFLFGMLYIYENIYVYVCVCAMCAIVRLLVSVSNIEIYSLVRCVHPLRLLFMHPFFFGSTSVPSSIWLGMRYVELVVDGGVTLMRDTHNKMIIITILYILLWIYIVQLTDGFIFFHRNIYIYIYMHKIMDIMDIQRVSENKWSVHVWLPLCCKQQYTPTISF